MTTRQPGIYWALQLLFYIPAKQSHAMTEKPFFRISVVFSGTLLVFQTLYSACPKLSTLRYIFLISCTHNQTNKTMQPAEHIFVSGRARCIHEVQTI